MAKSKRRKGIRFLVKTFLCCIYLCISFVLVLCSFRLYEKDKEIIEWKDVETTEEYSYLTISQMSEAFAVIKEEDKQLHFVIEQENEKVWHTYLIAIKPSDYNKYKQLIDYTYERTKQKQEPITIYGYPVKISDNIKNLAIKNIKNFVPIENKVVLTKENFEEYLTDTYLDTTKEKQKDLNYFIIILLLMAFVLFILTIFTIFDKDKIVDEVDHILEKEIHDSHKNKKKKKKKKKSQDEDIEVI